MKTEFNELVAKRSYLKIVLTLKDIYVITMSHGAIFLATCKAILLLRDVNL